MRTDSSKRRVPSGERGWAYAASKDPGNSNGSRKYERAFEGSLSKSGDPVKGRRTAMMRVNDGTSEPLMRGGLKRGGKQAACRAE